MKLASLLTAAALVVAGGTSAVAEELTKVRSPDDRTVLEFRYAGFDPEDVVQPVMTLEELRQWNPQFADATDETVVPAWTPIFYDQKQSD